MYTFFGNRICFCSSFTLLNMQLFGGNLSDNRGTTVIIHLHHLSTAKIITLHVVCYKNDVQNVITLKGNLCCDDGPSS